MKIITELLLLLFLFACPVVLTAQFTGGSGDGFTARLIIQLDLTGSPLGVRPLYAGGAGDGADRLTINVTLSGTELEQLFSGGAGDGADQHVINATVGGQSLAGLFRGGSGDGFDRRLINVTISGESLAQLFAGGSGDGFDLGGAAGALNGTVLTGIYSGGPGDGFDGLSFSGSISGAMLELYGGGSGDGFDEASGNFTISGQGLALLFAGGQGDGFTTEIYFGTLPLPLTLISFDATPYKDYVLLEWTTEDEVGTDFFTIEKTRQGRDFVTVGTVDAAGDSEPGERLYYELRDESPYDGTSFYRLRSTDLDQAISLSHLVEVNFQRAKDWDFVVFPNPNTGRQISLRPSGLEEGTALQLEILDVQGRSLLRDHLTTDGTDHLVPLSNPLPAGTYLIRVLDDQGAGKAKILIVQ